VFSDLYTLIKEDEKETEYKTDNIKTDDKNVISNKKDNKNVSSNKKDYNKKDNKNVISNKIDNKYVISNEIDDKPKPINLLDLDNDILNIIGDFVKKDNEEREEEELMDREQIINEKTIQFRNFNSSKICRSVNTKEDMKEYIFDYFNMEFPDIKTYASNAKIRLSNDDKRKCFWLLFKRCKLIINRNKEYYNKDVYNMDDNEEKEFFMEYLKLKNLSLPKNTTFEY
jgi:hypothetical protein